MPRLITALLVGGVVLLAVLAGVDVLRGEGESSVLRPAGTTTRPRPPTLQETLRREAVTGFVLYSDAQCRVHSLALPRMLDFIVRKEGTLDPVRRCGFALGDGRLLADDELISPDRARVVRCRHGHVEVLDALSMKLRSRVRGCAPAWSPDGRLTYARGEAVYDDGRRLLTRADLHAAARRHPNIAGLGAGIRLRVHVTALAWLDKAHVVASLVVRLVDVPIELQFLAVLFEEKTIVGVATLFGQPFGRWVVSATGSLAAAGVGTIIHREGGSVDPPQGLPTGTAVAFSPDERWLVYVTGVSAYLIGTPRNREPGRIIRLPVDARDFAWESGGPVTDMSKAG